MNALDDSANTDRCTLYEDLANFLKDECFTKTEYQTSGNLWKMNAEDTRITTWVSTLKWGKTKASASKRGKCVSTMMKISKKPPLLIAQDTQHKLRVAFEVRERNNDKYHHAYYTAMPLSHQFFVHVLFPVNLQGNPFKIVITLIEINNCMCSSL